MTCSTRAAHGTPFRIEPVVRLPIAGAACLVELLEPGAVGRERPPAVRRHALDEQGQRHVEPDREPVPIDQRAVLEVGKCAAAGRDDRVAEREQLEEHLALDVAEVRLAFAREDLGDRAVLAGLDALVDVFRAPAEPRAERARERRLAGAHEADQIHLVSPHASAWPASGRSRGRRRPPLRRRRRWCRRSPRGRRSQRPSPVGDRRRRPGVRR